jgi:Flp pilus assembly protein TadG
MNRQHSERGQALIEFAFIITVMILLALGAVNFALAIQQAMLVQEAATAGALYGSYSEYNAALPSVTQTVASSAGTGASGLTTVATSFCTCTAGGSTVSCTSSCSGDDPLLYVQVTASSSLSSFFHYSKLPSLFSLSTTVVMPVE